MEDIKIKQEVKFLESSKQWCCGIYCPQYEIWTGGYFHKDKNKAIAGAMESLKKSIKFKRECAIAPDVQELSFKF